MNNNIVMGENEIKEALLTDSSVDEVTFVRAPLPIVEN